MDAWPDTSSPQVEGLALVCTITVHARRRRYARARVCVRACVHGLREFVYVHNYYYFHMCTYAKPYETYNTSVYTVCTLKHRTPCCCSVQRELFAVRHRYNEMQRKRLRAAIPCRHLGQLLAYRCVSPCRTRKHSCPQRRTIFQTQRQPPIGRLVN